MDSGRMWQLKKAVRSGRDVAGMSAQEVNPEMVTDGESENWKGVHVMVESAHEVIKLKGHTNLDYWIKYG